MKSNYNSLVTQLTGLIEKHKELTEIIALADYDLKWRLSELYKNVKKTDEQKFINLSGMNNYLQTTEQKNNVSVIQNKEEKESKEFKEDKIILFSGLEKKDTEKTWAKSLYRRGVKRCHPDTIELLTMTIKVN